MKFYEMLSKHYAEIFPFSEETYDFLKDYTSDGDIILDVGSADAAYVARFNEDGRIAYGVEYFDKFSFFSPNTIIGDMKKLPINKDKKFKFIYSIGNTMVHCQDRKEFSDIITQLFEQLEDKGFLIIQIINYDMVLSNNVTSLPVIETDNIKFTRNYDYKEDSGKIEFTGILEDKLSNDVLTSSINLLPITIDEIKWVAGKIGASFVQFFGNFDGSKFFRKESMVMIAALQKK